MTILQSYDQRPGQLTGSGGGGGLHFRDPVDVFANAAARSAAFTAGGTLADDLAQFIDDRGLAIVIGTIMAPTDFQTYTGSAGTYDDNAWMSRRDAVRSITPGPQGIWYARIFQNASSAPSAAPAGGSIAEDGTITVPTGWVTEANLAAPATGEETYESIFLVNPASAAFPINNPGWSFPFGIGDTGGAAAAMTAQAAAQAAITAQAAAETAETNAETAETNAETAASRASASADRASMAESLAVGSPRGELLATSPILPVASTGQNAAIQFGANEVWTLTDRGTATGFSADATTEEIIHAPRKPAAGVNGVWWVVEVDGVEVGENFDPWGIQSTNRSDFPRLQRLFAGLDASDDAQYVNIDSRISGDRLYGGGTTLSANTVVKLYESVVRGAPGTVTGGVTLAQVDERIAAAGHASQAALDELQAALTALTARVARLEGFHGGAGTHSRRFAIAAGSALTLAEAMAATTSNTAIVTAPDATAWPAGTLRTRYIGVPEDEADITDLEQGGLSVFLGWGRYNDASDDAIIVAGHKWWTDGQAVDGEFNAGQMINIIQG